MRNKIFKGLLLTLVSLFGLTACSDDDQNISTTPIIKELKTTEAEVTAYSAVLKGTVNDLSGMASSAFTVGAYYSTDENNVKNGTKVEGSYEDGTISATVSGLETNKVYYYCVYVVLQGRVSYYGDVKSFVTTDAKLSGAATASVTASKANITATATGISGVPVDIIAGVKVSTTPDAEAVKNGLNQTGEISGSNISVTAKGLLPNTTYYYLPYIQLGDGFVYGEGGTFKTTAYTTEYVDLGLSVLWATTNLGAESESELGSYVGYGQTDPTFVSTNLEDYTITADIYGGANDAAAAAGAGRMPTADDVKELIYCTTQTWTTVDGVAGVRFTATNGNSIFLPAAGQRSGNDVTDDAVVGNYWLGQIESGNTDFGRTMQITAASAGVETAPRNVALSIRPVKKVPVEFKKALLNTTWYIDLDAEGKSYIWDGPLYFYGSDDSWTTVSDGDAIVGNSWAWQPSWTDSDISNWIGFAPQEFGSMTFSEDGKYSVTYADGSTKVGTYTIDENKKTITVAGEGVSILCPESTEYTYSNTTTDLHILALTEQKLQICVIRSDGQHMAMNFISGERKEYFAKPIYTVSLLSYGSADADWDNKATETVELYAGDTHTIKLEGERTCGTVTVLDFIGLRSKCPNAFIKIDKIKADGKEVSFDANKLLYGDLETNGNYRIELFNVWGAGTKNDSPFGGGAKDSEPALAFSQSLEITYTVVNMKDGQDGNMLEAGLSVEDHTWANSSWPDAKALLYFNGSVIGAQQSIKYEGSRLDGEIDVIDFNNAIINFPNMKLRVDEVLIDGKSLSFKAENIQYVANGDAYRIELFNPWGGTGSNNPWDTYDADNKCVPSLGFNSSFEVKYTVLNLF